jgi:RNA polymerase sigma-32 factor
MGLRNSSLVESAGLNKFLQTSGGFDILPAKVERDLLVQAISNRSLLAKHRLVTTHIRLAAKMARKYINYGTGFEDLVSVAMVGLTHSVEKFDLDKDVRFATYASWWIRAALMDHVIRNTTIFNLGTTAQRKHIFFKLNAYKKKLEQEGIRPEEMLSALATKLEVGEASLQEIMNAMNVAVSLDTPIAGDEAEAGTTFADRLVSPEPSPEETAIRNVDHDQQISKLYAVLGTMSERDNDIFRKRRLAEDPLTLEELATQYSVSKERIRQIEVKVFERVQKAMIAA